MTSQDEQKFTEFCAALEESIRRETITLEYYRSVTLECDSPEMQLHFRRLTAERSELIASLREKLAEVRIEREISGRIGSSFA